MGGGPDWNLADLFEAVAAAIPGQEAIVCGDRRISYGAVEERSTGLASYLQSRGIGRGDHVALYLTNCPEYLEAVLAAAKLGTASVNVNYRYLAAELAYVLRDSDAHALVFHRSFAPVVEAVIPSLPLLDVLVAVDDGHGECSPGVEDYEEALAAAKTLSVPPRSGDDLFLLYTGGTTGMPKGVMWHQRDLILGALMSGGMRRASNPGDVVKAIGRGPQRRLSAPPLMHGTGQWVALATFLAGGTVVLNPDSRFDARRLWELIAKERVELVSIVGDAMGRPLAEALADGAAEFDLGECRLLLSSGAVLSPAVKSAFAAYLPDLVAVDTYGASESGAHGRSITGAGQSVAGRARFGVEAQTAVLDDHSRPVVPGSGAVGRVARSGHVAFGYYKDPARTAEAFPVIDGVRWSVSGDHATVEHDGTVTLLGRRAVCINTGGEKVYPEEVEVVLKGHSAVRDALVVGVPDERFGERVVALVEPSLTGPPSIEELETHVRGLIAGYKVPKSVLLVETIRRSEAGKPDYPWGKALAMESLGMAQPVAQPVTGSELY